MNTVDTIGHIGDKSSQASPCTDTNKSKQTRENTQKHRINKLAP